MAGAVDCPPRVRHAPDSLTARSTALRPSHMLRSLHQRPGRFWRTKGASAFTPTMFPTHRVVGLEADAPVDMAAEAWEFGA